MKSHVKHIFLKLAVGTRAEAVSRVGLLGLFAICSLRQPRAADAESLDDVVVALHYAVGGWRASKGGVAQCATTAFTTWRHDLRGLATS
jgi:hypothetical protein